jgi:hypothetical protein
LVEGEEFVKANELVEEINESRGGSPTPSKRGTYKIFSPKQRYEIGKYASEHGNARDSRKFSPIPFAAVLTIAEFTTLPESRTDLIKKTELANPVFHPIKFFFHAYSDLKEKDKYLKSIKSKVEMYKMPPELLINWDQTGINIVPVSRWQWMLKVLTPIM